MKIYRILDGYFRKKAIEKHRKMWRWLAEHPDKGKLDYLLMHDPHARLINNCYACHYAARNYNPLSYYDNLCNHCPLDWDGRECSKNHVLTLFDEWFISESYEKRTAAARQIAELPEREDR